MKMVSTAAIAVLLASGSQVAQAQYRCTQADGSTAYQQAPCPTGQAEQRIKAPPPATPEQNAAAARARAMNAAILGGYPIVGMTRIELERAMGGLPDKANLAQYGADRKDQLIFYRGDRTIYVYTENGLVTSIQNTAGSPLQVSQRPTAPAKPCPSPTTIRDIEIRMSEFSNRGNDRLLAELARQLKEARECGR
jgi:Domain of unknown function (DUF4124)